MAYDFLYKTRVPVNCSMNKDQGPTLNKPTATLAGLLVATFVRHTIIRISRQAEKKRYQTILRAGHHPTLEMSVIPSNSELVFGQTGTDG